jgi:hypothetical protein
MKGYQPLARQLLLFLGIIVKVISTCIDEFVLWVEFLKEIPPIGLEILVVVILVQLLVPLEVFSTKEVSAMGPH